MPKFELTIIPDKSGADGPFASKVTTTHKIEDFNDVVIAVGNFLRTFQPRFEELHLFVRGEEGYYSSNQVGKVDPEPKQTEPVTVH